MILRHHYNYLNKAETKNIMPFRAFIYINKLL